MSLDTLEKMRNKFLRAGTSRNLCSVSKNCALAKSAILRIARIDETVGEHQHTVALTILHCTTANRRVAKSKWGRHCGQTNGGAVDTKTERVRVARVCVPEFMRDGVNDHVTE